MAYFVLGEKNCCSVDSQTSFCWVTLILGMKPDARREFPSRELPFLYIGCYMNSLVFLSSKDMFYVKIYKQMTLPLLL